MAQAYLIRQKISLRNYWENNVLKTLKDILSFLNTRPKRKLEDRKCKLLHSGEERESWNTGLQRAYVSLKETESMALSFLLPSHVILQNHTYTCVELQHVVFSAGRKRIKKGNLPQAAETWLMAGANSLTKWANSLVTPHHPGKIVRAHFLHLKSCAN